MKYFKITYRHFECKCMGIYITKEDIGICAHCNARKQYFTVLRDNLTDYWISYRCQKCGRKITYDWITKNRPMR